MSALNSMEQGMLYGVIGVAFVSLLYAYWLWRDTARRDKGNEAMQKVWHAIKVGANAYLGFQGNKDLVMNMVNWLSAEESLISIRPKSQEHQTLDMNQRQMGRLLYLGVFGVPLVIILIGAGVWWRRRR